MMKVHILCKNLGCVFQVVICISVIDSVTIRGNTDKPLALLVSYDGFRYDYLEHANAPNLKWLLSNGVYVPNGLKNTWITITAPNHYGIVTGLYAESHGIVANIFFDPVLNRTFNYYYTGPSTDPAFFNRTAPLWVTNDEPGSGRSTGCVMWVGCDVPIRGRRPNFFTSWNQSIAWRDRIDTLVGWFSDPIRPINLGLLYIEEPDETGHRCGPLSAQTNAVVEKLDYVTGYLIDRLQHAGLFEKINLIFTSDHGMAAYGGSDVIQLDKYLDPSSYRAFGGQPGPNLNVFPAPGKEDAIYQTLKGVPHLTVYRKAEIPAEYHYANTSGVLPLQLEAEIGWVLNSTARTTLGVPSSSSAWKQDSTGGRKHAIAANSGVGGSHGYNNSLSEMHPYFIARGPAFKNGYNSTQFMTIDVYLLMCYVLKIEPVPNNGSFERVRQILIDEGKRWKWKNEP